MFGLSVGQRSLSPLPPPPVTEWCLSVPASSSHLQTCLHSFVQQGLVAEIWVRFACAPCFLLGNRASRERAAHAATDGQTQCCFYVAKSRNDIAQCLEVCLWSRKWDGMEVNKWFAAKNSSAFCSHLHNLFQVTVQ